MPNYRDNLPQLGERLFLTDGGIETTLIFGSLPTGQSLKSAVERIGETCSKLFHPATEQIRGAGAPAVATSPMRIQREGRNDNA